MNKDPQLYSILKKELAKQRNTINLIASESFAPLGILEMQGSILNNKAVEGYPAARYHSGCEWFDEIEKLAIKRACQAFNAEHANVQPHSGINANLAVYNAVLKPQDKILAMNIKHGGHLSHGSKASLSSKIYQPYSYGVREEDGIIDYEQIERLALKYHPQLIITGGSSYPRDINYQKIKAIANRINAYFLVDAAHTSGLIAANHLNNPLEHADFVTATCYKTLCGSQGGFILTHKKLAAAIDKSVFPGLQGSLQPQIIAGKAYTFKMIQSSDFKVQALQIIRNAKSLAHKLQQYNFDILTSGTDTHIVMVNLAPLKITGAEAEKALASIGILVNKNLIPYDNLSPRETSGIRIGTTAMTCRGATEEHMLSIAEIIYNILQAQDKNINSSIKKVQEICSDLPLYQGLTY